MRSPLPESICPKVFRRSDRRPMSSSDDTAHSIPAPQPAGRRPKRKAKDSLLEWWAIFPAASFVVVEAVFGGPKEPERANDMANYVGFIVGGCLFGFVASLLLAWFAYRMIRRSRLAATLVFSLLIEFFALVAFGNWLIERTHRASTRTYSPSSGQSASPRLN